MATASRGRKSRRSGGIERQSRKKAAVKPLSACQKTLGLLRGGCPLSFIPALTACTSERMKTQRFSYLATFAAREREAKPVKTRKSGVQPLF